MSQSSHIGYSVVKRKSSLIRYDMHSRNGYYSDMSNRIKELMRERGLSRDDVADGIGAHPITVSKLISGKMKLTTDYLAKFAKVFNVEPEEVISASTGIRKVKVRAHVQAGHWSEAFEWDPEDWYEVAIPDDPDLRTLTLFGAETRGPSMNRRYPERSVVIVAEAISAHEHVQLGKRYVIERERPDGLREATVKKVWRDEAGRIWLLPESDDPRFQEPIPLEGGADDTIRIVGRVVYSVQRED